MRLANLSLELLGSSCTSMKNLISHPLSLGLIMAISSISSTLAAETPNTNTVPADAATQPQFSAPVVNSSDSAAPVKEEPARLPYGTADVVKLSRSQVGEDVIVSYVQNSGIAYSLSSDDILRLRGEGVSDRVINAMLNQHKKAVEAAQIAEAPAPANNDVPVSNSNSAPTAGDSQPAPEYSANSVAEAPLTPPASSTYVIPSQPAAPAYYGYPYYYPYYYGGPIVSFRFGFGGGYGHYHGHRWH